MEIDSKIEEISKRKGFTNFWEVVSYMLVTGSYTEVEAINTALSIFDTDIWDNVISSEFTRYYEEPSPEPSTHGWVSASGMTTTAITIDTMDFRDEDECEEVKCEEVRREDDDIIVTIHILKNVNKRFTPMYKSYLNVKRYEANEELDKNIKKIEILITTEILKDLFHGPN